MENVANASIGVARSGANVQLKFSKLDLLSIMDVLIGVCSGSIGNDGSDALPNHQLQTPGSSDVIRMAGRTETMS